MKILQYILITWLVSATISFGFLVWEIVKFKNKLQNLTAVITKYLLKDFIKK